MEEKNWLEAVSGRSQLAEVQAANEYTEKFGLALTEELLQLDYPVPELPAGLRGIDLIYEYLRHIEKEQEFLRSFPEGYVRQVCEAYHEGYEELFVNLAEVVRKEDNLNGHKCFVK